MNLPFMNLDRIFTPDIPPPVSGETVVFKVGNSLAVGWVGDESFNQSVSSNFDSLHGLKNGSVECQMT